MVSKHTIGTLLNRAREILKNEGLIALCFKTIRYLKQNIFVYKKYYIYEHILKERSETNYYPKVKGFIFKIISSNVQLDKIIKEGFEDFRELSLFVNVRSCLNKGAIAFCFFKGKKLAHIGWVATNQEAKNTFDNLPYYVDFSNGQACTGGSVTLPIYRSKGFMA
ncbi:MAG: hypothetical protein JSV74_01350, partial [Dehalococcoidia bacterium]